MTEEIDELRDMEAAFARAERLAGYVVGLKQRGLELGLIAIAVGAEHIEGDDLMSVAEQLQAAADSVRTSADNVKAAIDDAIARLSDNPNAEQIQGVIDSLSATKSELDTAAGTAATIDPNDTSGGVVDDGSGGVVEAPPAEGGDSPPA